MNHDNSGISSSFEKKANREQFDQVVEAILAGKYSWACVLMLRFSGYNPLHYIPYRTYNRLLKENSTSKKSNQQLHDEINKIKTTSDKSSENRLAAACLNKIKDLAYMEVGGQKKNKSRNSGTWEDWLSTQIDESQSNDSNLSEKTSGNSSLRLMDK
ncbi:HetP family heterocyst commitment protein [Calothrix sp. PCC 6303]|uniref:HetP family heterocyst commitment protein n=1 Tax=Calothrix sp. PCC 6303 TaxID=1170562 RepID=UPI0002A04751|nr:HetP family heterocyst commitment protein [Calothrix sp. PCC 6303]AFY99237.1 hypothetical protein Cal6303_0129 [Calothrix sp. PCC 6303]